MNKVNDLANKDVGKRFHVRLSDKKILKAFKSPNGSGYVYKSKSADGSSRNIHIKNNIYKSEEEALRKVERLKKA